MKNSTPMPAIAFKYAQQPVFLTHQAMTSHKCNTHAGSPAFTLLLLIRHLRCPLARGGYDSKGSQSRHSTSLLLDLPLPALALIYQHCDDESRKALLRVSAGCRDWVLREARSISIELKPSIIAAARKPLARLLNRACTQSESGLSLCLHFGHHEGQTSKLLADLLKPGIQQSGWVSVAKLVLKVSCSEPK
jgi:hypothetical protein